MSLPTWDWPPYPSPDLEVEAAVDRFFVLNALNYCFHDEVTGRRYENGGDSGAVLLARKLDEHFFELVDPEWLVEVTPADVVEVLGHVPRLMDRVDSLRQAGALLARMKAVELSWGEVIRGAETAMNLAEVVSRMSAAYSGDPFRKRAQLFVGMLCGRFHESETHRVPLPGTLTLYADYRVPQALIELGVLVPSSGLQEVLQRRTPIPRGSRLELEIRAQSVVAGDLLAAELEVPPVALDFCLWKWARGEEIGTPHHVTYTTDY